MGRRGDGGRRIERNEKYHTLNTLEKEQKEHHQTNTSQQPQKE